MVMSVYVCTHTCMYLYACVVYTRIYISVLVKTDEYFAFFSYLHQNIHLFLLVRLIRM